jgi:hypothetical protein
MSFLIFSALKIVPKDGLECTLEKKLTYNREEKPGQKYDGSPSEQS